jgi:hypothetical protein
MELTKATAIRSFGRRENTLYNKAARGCVNLLVGQPKYNAEEGRKGGNKEQGTHGFLFSCIP